MQKSLSIEYPWLAILTLAAVRSSIRVDGASPHDPLTGLPVYPGITDPSSLPQADFCGKQMQGDFYIVVKDRVDVVTNWYGRHLPGFRQYHARTDGRSQDTFFSSDGTREVTVTGSKAGTAVYSISYGRFQPGLSAREMASFNQPKETCPMKPAVPGSTPLSYH
jgi:hypothetical protein